MGTILGIDIDREHVRGVVIRTALRRSQILRYAEATLPQRGEAGGASADLRAAVDDLIAGLHPPPDRVLAALSGDAVSIRRVALPAKVAKRANELLPFELEALVPFSPESAVVDHQVIEQSGGEMKLLAAVAPKDRVRDALAMWSAVGIEPRELGVGAVALDGITELIPSLGEGQPFGLIDVRNHHTDVCAVSQGTCHFARTVSVGLADVDAGRVERFTRELKQTLAAYRLEAGHGPEQLFLLGTLAEREGGTAWLGELLGVSVNAIALPPATGTADAPRPAFGRAAALAARAVSRRKRLNLRQGEFEPKETMTAIRQHLPLMLGCAAALALAFVFSGYTRYSVLSARYAALREELADATKEHMGREIRDPAQAMERLTRGIRGNDPVPDFDAYDALAAISESIPEGIEHDVRQLHIDLGDGEETARFSLRGTVNTVAEAERIATALLEYRRVQRLGNDEVRLSCFHEITPGSTNRTRNNRRSYRLEGEIHCDPEDQSEGQSGGRKSKKGRGRRRSR